MEQELLPHRRGDLIKLLAVAIAPEIVQAHLPRRRVAVHGVRAAHAAVVVHRQQARVLNHAQVAQARLEDSCHQPVDQVRLDVQVQHHLAHPAQLVQVRAECLVQVGLARRADLQHSIENLMRLGEGLLGLLRVVGERRNGDLLEVLRRLQRGLELPPALTGGAGEDARLDAPEELAVAVKDGGHLPPRLHHMVIAQTVVDEVLAQAVLAGAQVLVLAGEVRLREQLGPDAGGAHPHGRAVGLAQAKDVAPAPAADFVFSTFGELLILPGKITDIIAFRHGARTPQDRNIKGNWPA